MTAQVVLKCFPGKKVFGVVSPGSTGEIRVGCSASRCQRPGNECYHRFNLANGVYVTEYVGESPKKEHGNGVVR